MDRKYKVKSQSDRLQCILCVAPEYVSCLVKLVSRDLFFQRRKQMQFRDRYLSLFILAGFKSIQYHILWMCIWKKPLSLLKFSERCPGPSLIQLVIFCGESVRGMAPGRDTNSLDIILAIHTQSQVFNHSRVHFHFVGSVQKFDEVRVECFVIHEFLLMLVNKMFCFHKPMPKKFSYSLQQGWLKS